MKKISIKIFINIVLIIIFIVCSFRIAYQYFQYNKDGKSYSKVQILKPKLDETNKKDSNEDKLKKINKHGWIYSGSFSNINIFLEKSLCE